ncbi:bifunctional YncE family protein/alkaline phosphatase family protein [Tuwongella immobilis]|uniref:Uncharacterized protein n=1 Tax=Tuwongella immobilis TaxID=692036 RepID=A0A6C2YVC8_9BACT|nr:alkaline phosphatase family protein [Tuwongella immobilis]VIP05123.1 40-residue yvtn family beta-propeller repeat protein : Hypothetical conserved protein OS=uncultured planctomycete GN=HGMM_F37F03C22 PE=4 SV=1: Lactonase: Phosphoesterase [Tuwongella immobilis]VTS07602.1 40-residue yvtn family beta-propeller repeat protein : Hypothetical conserved protein OS=uncultured planctomycete GN=HGMM_F37F03C22 PE=4 SV=1: Lactonase: Phosphoesterase [Tuwongella immobilis]
MRSRSILAGLVLIGGTLVLLLGLSERPQLVAEAAPLKPTRDLPGMTTDGFIQLPNQWKLRPAGTAQEVGDLPVNIALHPTGDFAAVLHSGMRDHEVIILGLKPRTKIISRFVLDQTFYGMTFSPDGKQLFVSGAEFERIHQFQFENGVLSQPKTIALKAAVPSLIIGGIAIAPSGKELFAAGTWGDVVFRIPLEKPSETVTIAIPNPTAGAKPNDTGKDEPKPAAKPELKGEPPSPDDGRDVYKPKKGVESFPYTVLPERNGKRLFVSLWSQGRVAVIDLATNTLQTTWETASHPTEMVQSADGNYLFVACSNSTRVSVLDLATGAAVQTVNCALYPTAPSGNTPNSLSMTPDGKLLFVANAAANNLTVLNVENPKKVQSLGFIPTGWYPTSVRYNPADRKLYVANGKGMISKPNRNGPNPYNPFERSLVDYIGSLFRGTVSTIPMPTPEQLAAYSKTAFACSPLRADAAPRSENVPANSPIPRIVGQASPIKHVIYVIKENRTYDQVFGDMKEGNGDPSICLFPEPITPNHHALAREFVLLDNFYVDGEVSADGHEWSMGAYATDFVEKHWPLSYRGAPSKNKIGYPSEGSHDQAARPAGGYLWDRAKEAGVSYRSYGEWVSNGKTANDPGVASVPALVGHIDPGFRGYDLDYLDVDRAKRFLSEVKRFEQLGEMPALQIVRLPNDHTYGTRIGKPTPTAMVAENDLALGLLVEGMSQSKFWPTTAIFVLEDDAQNGPDHVDAHRSPALVISPYTARKTVDSTMYSTSSMLRTMELILGLQPMSQFDAAARPMYGCFTDKPDLTGYTHRVPKTDLNAKNQPGAFGAKWSETPDLTLKEDAVDDLIFNEIIWRSVKGANSPMPAPVRAAFFRGKIAANADADDDDDD